MQGILKHSDAIKFILAGNSTVTFLNTKTQKRFTYRIKLKENGPHFVKVLTNPDVYQFIGSTFNQNFKHSQKSKIGDDAQSVKVFQYVFNKLKEGTLDPCIEIWHEGRCGRCNRPLTVPESIETGIGPECLKMMSGHKSIIRQAKIDKILKSVQDN